jgi:hypothetical protein
VDSGARKGQEPVPVHVRRYLERIRSASGDLPVFPDHLHDVMAVLTKDDTSMQQLANLILKDYSLTLKVLRTANTPRCNRTGQQVLSVTQAMVLLGAEAVRDLAANLLLVDHFQAQAPGLKPLMALSMLTASHAKSAAEHVGLVHPEEAHLAGMYRNVGEVAIACHAPQDYAAILERVTSEGLTPDQVCKAQLQFRFDELGAAICREWGLAGFGAATDKGRRQIDRVVAFGHDLTTAVYRHGSDTAESVNLVLQRHGSDLGLTPDVVYSMVQEAKATTRQVFAGMGVSAADLSLASQGEAAARAYSPGAKRLPGADELAAAEQRAQTEQSRARLLEEIAGSIERPSRFDLNETALTVLEAMLRSGPFSRAVFCLLNEQRGELVGRFGLGEAVDSLVRRLRVQLTTGPQGLAIGAAVLRRSDLLISSTRNPASDESRLLALVGARSVIVLPLVIENTAVGAIYADRVVGDEPDASTVNFAHRLRELVVRALVLARRGRTTTNGSASPPGRGGD